MCSRPMEAFLLNMLQITERELRRAKISQMVYQAAFRGVLRIQESDEKFLTGTSSTQAC
jgi:hypothetical protein